jgi:3',5'-cyclic AMP phosphodiesterase CpdA
MLYPVNTRVKVPVALFGAVVLTALCVTGLFASIGLLTLRGASFDPAPDVLSESRRTQPSPPFFFIQLSDPQFGMFTDNRDFAQETINFEFAIATVNRLRPAFVVITGDLVNKAGDPAQINEYLRITRKLDAGIPLYQMAGNHDVENVPTRESVAAYVRQFGPDHYTFTHRGLVGIVLNSSLVHSPQGDPEDAATQEQWLRSELTRARASGARHLVVIQHHPWFLESAAEPDQYFNIPLVRRTPYLTMFHEAGVKVLLSGHYHRNAVARDGDIEMITTGPVGKPLGGAKSGIRVVTVNDAGLTHRYYELGEIPATIELK